MCKKTIKAMVLFLMMSLCACGGSQGTVDEMQGNNPVQSTQEVQVWEETTEQIETSQQEITGQEQTEEVPAWKKLTTEQSNLLRSYLGIKGRLKTIAGEEYHNKTKTGELENIYKKLCEMTAVDAIPQDIAQAYLDHYGYEEDFQGEVDRQALLDKFTILSDVKIYQTQTITKRDGSVSDKTKICWNYTEEGEVFWEDPFINDWLTHNSLTDYILESEYDEAGRLTRRQYYDGGGLKYTITYTHDDKGHLVKEHRVPGYAENGIDYEITCDAQGRIATIQWVDFWDITMTYTYDDAGNVLSIEKNEVYNDESKNYLLVYQYDSNGMLDSAQSIYWTSGYGDDVKREWPIDYTCDDKGRVVSYTMTLNDTYFTTGDQAGSVAGENENATVTVDTVYGDYYFYHP